MIALLTITLTSIVLLASGSAGLRGETKLGRPLIKNDATAFLLDPNGINGTIADSVTTLPIKDANVTAGSVFDLTDSNGHYELEVAAGNYTVSVTRLGYFSQSKNATVLINMTTTVDFALSPNPAEMGWIAGNVTNAANATMLIAGATVEANGYSTQTNATGQYEIQVPAPEDYSVTASKIGYEDKTVNNVSVNPGNTTVVNIALTPVPPVGILEGNVTDASTHMPIEDAVIKADSESAETNSSGRYRIELAPGTYNVTASKNGYVNQTKMGIVIEAGNVTTLNFELVRQQIRATVVIHPRSLNLRSEGRWISASIEFEAGFNVRDINVSSIRLNDTVPIDLAAPIEFSESTLIVKFSREAVETFILNALGEPSKFSSVTLTLTGKLNDGTTFTGSDTIKTIFNMPNPEPEIIVDGN